MARRQLAARILMTRRQLAARILMARRQLAAGILTAVRRTISFQRPRRANARRPDILLDPNAHHVGGCQLFKADVLESSLL
jgi:hypothetical protein